MPSFTGSGKPRKSFFDEPTQSSGFSAFDNVRAIIYIPLSGWDFKAGEGRRPPATETRARPIRL
jgi:hypothetical protein